MSALPNLLVDGLAPSPDPPTAERDAAIADRLTRWRDEADAIAGTCRSRRERLEKLRRGLADPAVGTEEERRWAKEREKAWASALSQSVRNLATLAESIVAQRGLLSPDARRLQAADRGEPWWADGDDDAVLAALWATWDVPRPPRAKGFDPRSELRERAEKIAVECFVAVGEARWGAAFRDACAFDSAVGRMRATDRDAMRLDGWPGLPEPAEEGDIAAWLLAGARRS